MSRRKRVPENQPDLLPEHEHNPGQLDADGLGVCVECGETVDTGEPIRREVERPAKERKVKDETDCRHWSLDCVSMKCNECGRYFELVKSDPAADRDAHNARVLANMKSGHQSGMGETEENS